MSDDQDSRTEEPSQRRLSEAFGRGQFPRAEEINAAFLLLAFTALLMFFIGPKCREMMAFGRYVLENLNHTSVTRDTASAWLTSGVIALMQFLAPVFVLSCLAAIMGGSLQSGLKFTPDAIQLSFDKLNPVNGFQRLFSLKSLVQGGVDVLKLIGVVFVLYGLLSDIRNDPIFYSPMSVQALPEFMYRYSVAMFMRITVAMAVIAAANYAYQRWQMMRDMRMTKQEVKDERKQQEGDPLVKSAQRRAALRFARGQMLKAVPTADVVVTNPTHFAVALKYERGKDSAPVVVAKGLNLFALRIKDVAREHEVPMVENRPLARALYRIAKVGKPIPSELYQAVADVLAFVYRKYRYYFYRLKYRRAQSR